MEQPAVSKEVLEEVKKFVEEGEEAEGGLRTLSGPIRYILGAIAIVWTLFQLYTSATVYFGPAVQSSIHLGFALILIFTLYTGSKTARRDRLSLFDLLLVAVGVIAMVRVILTGGDIRPEVSANPSVSDLILGTAMIGIIFEATRRSTGAALPWVMLAFLAYVFVGPWLPGMFGHQGFTFQRVIATAYLTESGIYGAALIVSSTIVFVFLAFGAFLFNMGGGQAFIDIASALMGHIRGGPAKIGVIASGLMGTVTGSGVANVATVGVFTIPLMTRLGYKPHIAAGIEAGASVGAQLMPPVMGISAFIMAQFLNVSYATIAIAAVFPAILYYISVFATVDLEAAATGLKGLPKEQLPKVSDVLKQRWHLLISPAILLGFLFGPQLSPDLSAFYTIVVMIATHLVRELIVARRFDWKPLVQGLEGAAKSACPIAAATASIGIIIAATDLTGIGLKFAGIMIDLAGGNLFLLLIYTAIASIILGTGLPTTLAYIILAIFAAPALIQMGITPIAAHLFVFYFGVMSDLTPPVAISPYVAARIAGEPEPLKACFTAMRIALPAYILPFFFVYDNSLLLRGPIWDIALSTTTAMMGVYGLASGITGYLLIKMHWWERVLMVVGGLALVSPLLWATPIGIVMEGAVVARQWVVSRQVRKVTAFPEAEPSVDPPQPQ